jgi:hypothetical protein
MTPTRNPSNSRAFRRTPSGKEGWSEKGYGRTKMTSNEDMMLEFIFQKHKSSRTGSLAIPTARKGPVFLAFSIRRSGERAYAANEVYPLIFEPRREPADSFAKWTSGEGFF